MPTAGRLSAAICFALLGVGFAYLATPFFSEARAPWFWYPLNGVVGIIVGWKVVGSRVGRGMAAGLGNGITGTVALLFWVLFFMSFAEMIRKSMRKAYDDPLEAVVGVFEIMGEYVIQFADVQLGIFLAVGSLVVGFIVEFIGSRLP